MDPLQPENDEVKTKNTFLIILMDKSLKHTRFQAQINPLSLPRKSRLSEIGFHILGYWIFVKDL